jgi:hypothetical protein
VAGAHTVGVRGAAGALASRAVVSLETSASAGLAITDTLVRALTILVSGVGQNVAVQILSSRVTLGSSEGVHGIICDDGGIGVGQFA